MESREETFLDYARKVKAKLEADPNYRPVLIGAEIQQGFRGMVYRGTTRRVEVDEE